MSAVSVRRPAGLASVYVAYSMSPTVTWTSPGAGVTLVSLTVPVNMPLLAGLSASDTISPIGSVVL